MSTNDDSFSGFIARRVASVDRSLRRRYEADSNEEAARDAFTDLLHWCVSRGVDADAAYRQAMRHAMAEQSDAMEESHG